MKAKYKNMILTKHSVERSSQRGLNPHDLEILFNLGKLGFCLKSTHSGAVHWFFGKKNIYR